MIAYPPVVCMLVTYRRTCLAVRTVEALLKNLCYPHQALSFHIADDGSPPEHVEAIRASLDGHLVTATDARRQGVGVSMNLGMVECLKRADLILWLEDDWELVQPFDLRPCVSLLQEREDAGMVRLGYVSPGIRGELIGGAGHCWWRLEKGPTYTFVGHASLRHRRFCETYGAYQAGLPPGATELYMCGTHNNRPGPAVIVPAWTGEWGPFGHIGAESLKDVAPEVGP